MYVRSLEVPAEIMWEKVTIQMERMGVVRNGSFPGLFIQSALANEVVTAGLSLVENDPCALIANRNDVKLWVEGGGKEREVAELSSGSGLSV